ncbi:hypothetical protein ACQF36_31975 [Streptomyces sp. Marseille-Q5077]
MRFQGDVIAWVATHRRHHAFTDRHAPDLPADRDIRAVAHVGAA